MKNKIIAAVAALAGAMMLAACQPVDTTGNPPPPPASLSPEDQGGGNVYIFELFVRTFDCRPIYNPGGGCTDEVHGFFSGNIKVVAGPGKNGAATIRDSAGQLHDTTLTQPVAGYPAHGEWTVAADISFVYAIAHVDRLPPGARVRCDLYFAGSDYQKPGIVQLGGIDDYVNEGDTTTSGDAICGYPTGFTAPKIG